jgi:hypothetical protein
MRVGIMINVKTESKVKSKVDDWIRILKGNLICSWKLGSLLFPVKDLILWKLG